MAFEFMRKAMNGTKATVYDVPALYNQNLPALRPVGNEITFYPQDSGERFITKGYNTNDSIASIVRKNTRKFAQLRLYHRRAKAGEGKALMRSFDLAKDVKSLYDAKAFRTMVKAISEDYAVDSKLASLLNQPTRNDTQALWLEQTFGYLELTGETPLLLNRGLTEGPPLEMLLVPKQHVNLIMDPTNPWEIQAFELVIGTMRKRIEKEDMLLWKYPSMLPLDNPEHLRGQAPLEPGATLMQSMNEADERVAISNKNAGASGLAFLKNLQKPTVEQANDIRRQFNSAVNNAEMASKVAILGGEWGYINFGYSLDQLKILEQYGIGFTRLCNIFQTPPGIFGQGNDTYENVRQYKRDWIFDKINPSMAAFRGLLQDKLIREFDLDPQRDFIDYDIMSLPELSQELSEQVSALKDATWLTDNEKRDYCGYEPKQSPVMDLTARELEEMTGGPLDAEMEDLNV